MVYKIFIIILIEEDNLRDGRLKLTWIVKEWVMRCGLNHMVQRMSFSGFLSSQKLPFRFQNM